VPFVTGTSAAPGTRMVAPFPHHYRADVQRVSAGRALVEAPPRRSIAGCAPSEFGGRDDDWSPEHLLLGAIGLCLETTFEALATRAQLAVESWDVRVDGTVDRTEAGLAFTAISAVIRVTVAPELVERAREVAHRARHCLISSSLRVPVDVAAVVTPATIDTRAPRASAATR
jgi:organic hydroperoxide reductase OsmC/OhrA